MMINRLTHNNAAAIALQNAAELRRAQSGSSSATSSTAQQTGAQYNFAEIFGGANWGETEEAQSASPAPVGSPGGFSAAIATATANVTEEAVETPEAAATATPSDSTASTSATPATAGSATTPGVEALVSAIMNGSFQPSYVTNLSQLQEINPAGTDTMPNFYYASDQTASQLASLLGGTVVQMAPFGTNRGWSEPVANFIQLPNGQTFNAADVAYYANTGAEGAGQLTADITATINEGAAWTKYYQGGGPMPSFAEGYVGPPITGMTYSASSIGANGDVVNPAMQSAT
jgi:hypothetical protein